MIDTSTSDVVLEDWPWHRGQIFEAWALASDLPALALRVQALTLALWHGLGLKDFKRDKNSEFKERTEFH
jgi:hypothetical protein